MSCYKWGFKKGDISILSLSLRNYPHLNDHKYNVSCFFSQRKASWKLNEMKKFLVILRLKLPGQDEKDEYGDAGGQDDFCFCVELSVTNLARPGLHHHLLRLLLAQETPSQGDSYQPFNTFFTLRENASSSLWDKIFFIRSENYPGQCKWLKIRNGRWLFKNHRFLKGKAEREGVCSH